MKIPCLLRVTIPGGEDKDVVEERVEKLGWQGTGLREAGPVEVKEGVGRAVGPEMEAGPEVDYNHGEESDGLGAGPVGGGCWIGEDEFDGLVAGPVGSCWCWVRDWNDGLDGEAGPVDGCWVVWVVTSKRRLIVSSKNW